MAGESGQQQLTENLPFSSGNAQFGEGGVLTLPENNPAEQIVKNQDASQKNQIEQNKINYQIHKDAHDELVKQLATSTPDNTGLFTPDQDALVKGTADWTNKWTSAENAKSWQADPSDPDSIKLALERQQESQDLQGKGAQSKKDAAYYQNMETAIATNPLFDTPQNKALLQKFYDTPLGQRQPITLIPKPTIDWANDFSQAQNAGLWGGDKTSEKEPAGTTTGQPATKDQVTTTDKNGNIITTDKSTETEGGTTGAGKETTETGEAGGINEQDKLAGAYILKSKTNALTDPLWQKSFVESESEYNTSPLKQQALEQLQQDQPNTVVPLYDNKSPQKDANGNPVPSTYITLGEIPKKELSAAYANMLASRAVYSSANTIVPNAIVEKQMEVDKKQKDANDDANGRYGFINAMVTATPQNAGGLKGQKFNDGVISDVKIINYTPNAPQTANTGGKTSTGEPAQETTTTFTKQNTPQQMTFTVAYPSKTTVTDPTNPDNTTDKYDYTKLTYQTYTIPLTDRKQAILQINNIMNNNAKGTSNFIPDEDISSQYNKDNNISTQTQQNITQSDYNALPIGGTYYFNGQQYTKNK